MENNLCALSFSLAPNIGPKTYLQLVKYFKTAEIAWRAKENDLKSAGLGPKTLHEFLEFRSKLNIDSYLAKLKEKQVDFVSQDSKLYPPSLKKLENPPIGLFVIGDKSLLANTNRSIAVVGTRKPTRYGREVTEKLVEELVGMNFAIVSGLALGVDAIAHKTALGNHGATIAVLGCGVDCPTPVENSNLYFQILNNNGMVISEYPLSEPPRPGTFPARNRIIAAISHATLVTEAAADSGSLITAEWAQKLEKKVFAVPGPITSSLSDGTAYLLKNGAQLVTTANDILRELNIKPHNSTSQTKDFSHINLSDEELKIINLLQIEPLSVNAISKMTNIPVYRTLSLLSQLQLHGIVKDLGGKIFEMV